MRYINLAVCVLILSIFALAFLPGRYGERSPEWKRLLTTCAGLALALYYLALGGITSLMSVFNLLRNLG